MGLKNYGLQPPSPSLVQQVLRVNEKSELVPVMKAALRVFILDYFVARQRLATVAAFPRSCVAQALSRGDGPRNSLHASA